MAVAVGGVVLAGCQLPDFGARTPVSTQGTDAVKLWQGFFIAGLALFVFMCVLMGWAIVHYRRRSDGIPHQTQYHIPLEIFYSATPIVFVLILFGFTFVTENNVDALPKQNLTVTVTGFQWGWRFHYTTRHVTVIGVELQDPELVLPTNEPVRIKLQSHDVIHGFYVPDLDFSRYAQPGIVNQFTITMTKTGTFRGQCSQFCGIYHSLMRFRLKGDTPSQFAAWVRTHHSTSANPPISTAQQGALTHASGSTASGSTGISGGSAT